MEYDMSKPSNLAASLLAARQTSATAEKGEKRYLSSAEATDDMSKRDREYLAASVEVVLLMIGECLTSAATSLLTNGPKVPRPIDVDASRVSLKDDGSKVTANYPVGYPLSDGSTRWLNFTVTVPSGEVANYLRPFAARVSK